MSEPVERFRFVSLETRPMLHLVETLAPLRKGIAPVGLVDTFRRPGMGTKCRPRLVARPGWGHQGLQLQSSRTTRGRELLGSLLSSLIHPELVNRYRRACCMRPLRAPRLERV